MENGKEERNTEKKNREAGRWRVQQKVAEDEETARIGDLLEYTTVNHLMSPFELAASYECVAHWDPEE